jgi:hypothetical protein
MPVQEPFANMKTWTVVLIVLVFAALALRFAAPVRSAVYSAFREVESRTATRSVAGWTTVSTPSVEVAFRGDPVIAAVVLEAAQEQLDIVSDDLRFVPEKRILVILHETREELRGAFGWPESEDAMGVYWGGVVRVLSPAAWVDTNDIDVISARFRAESTLGHEFTHLLLDYMTQGNYPRWFSEGLAQYEEYLISGHVWTEPYIDGKPPYYSYGEMASFERLDDQVRAYNQAFLMVYYMAREYGWERMIGLIDALSSGQPFNAAVHTAYGFGEIEMARRWTAWAEALSVPPYSMERPGRDVRGGTG